MRSYYAHREGQRSQRKSGRVRVGRGVSLQKHAQKLKIPAVIKEFDVKSGGFIQKALANLTSKNILSGYTDVIGNLKTDTTGRIKHNPIIQKTRIKDKSSTIGIERAPTTRLDTAISMYMPTNIKVDYGAKYTDTEIGVFSEAVSNNSFLLSGTIISAADILRPEIVEYL